MAAEPEISEHLRRAIEQRLDELGIDPTEFVRRTGLTAPALSNLRKGHVRRYQKRLTRPVTEVLGWTPDSIDRLLRGEPATLLHAPRDQPGASPTASPASSLNDTKLILTAIANATGDVTEALEDVDRRLRAVEKALGLRAHRGRTPTGVDVAGNPSV